MLGEFEFEI
jgi:kinesin family protein 12